VGFINWFGKNTKKQEHNINGEVQDGTEELAPYSGMKVEVTTLGGDLLFVAKLHGLRGDAAELHQYSETELSQESEPVRVKIRGYNDHERKAVHMEGVISPLPKHIWQVEELTVIKTGNDRAFFRLSTDLDATVTMFSGLEIGEKPCRLLNISVGGARIESEYRYHENDKFLLKVQLLEDRPESAIFCQVLRIIEGNGYKYQYGCQFIELTEEDQEKITQNIFAAQLAERRKKRGDS
jgi:hypothetical protein